MKLFTRINSYAWCLRIIPVIVSVASVFAERTLVDIIVAQNVKSELQPKLDRLATDLRNEGYTARITSWPAGKSGRDVWNHLKDAYDNDNLQGALLVGHVPATTVGNGKNVADIPYWDMSSYSSMQTKHIWVSRLYGPIPSDHYAQPKYDYGDEIRYLGNAIDANHEYRTGKTRLPHTAFTHTCIRREGQNKACKGHQVGVTWANTARGIWPEARALYAEQLPDAMFEWGGDLLDEVSHGTYVSYAERQIHQDKILKYGCRIRTILSTSCTVGGFGSVVNIQNVCDNTYNVISVGATAHDYVHWNGEWDHTILDNDGSAFRKQLKSGKAWGPAMINTYPFENDEKTVMYGDLSLKPMMFPPGEPTPEYTITVIAKPGGVISPSRPVRVLQGNNETFSITPAELCFIQDVLIDGNSVSAGAEYTFENVQSDHTIEAVFASTSATIVSEDFESGDLSGGAGSWTGTWTGGEVVTSHPHTGTSSITLSGEKGYTTRRSFTVLGSRTPPITLEMWYYGRGFSGDDKLRIDFLNKGNYGTLGEPKNTGGEYRRLEYDLSPYWQGSGVKYRIRFMLPHGSGTTVYIDEIRVYSAGGDDDEPPGRASSPNPAHGTRDIANSISLIWIPGSGAESHIVYFGTDATPDTDEKQGTQTTTVFDPGALEKGTTYYWRIDEVNEHGMTTGEVWSFTTADDAVNVEELSRECSLPRITCANGNILLHTGSRTGIPATVTIADPRGRIVWKQSFEHTRVGDIIPFPPHFHGTFFVTLRAGTTRLQKRITVIE